MLQGQVDDRRQHADRRGAAQRLTRRDPKRYSAAAERGFQMVTIERQVPRYDRNSIKRDWFARSVAQAPDRARHGVGFGAWIGRVEDSDRRVDRRWRRRRRFSENSLDQKTETTRTPLAPHKLRQDLVGD